MRRRGSQKGIREIEPACRPFPRQVVWYRGMRASPLAMLGFLDAGKPLAMLGFLGCGQARILR